MSFIVAERQIVAGIRERLADSGFSQNIVDLDHEHYVNFVKKQPGLQHTFTMLGFEHSQSFSTLFKKKTKISPVQFRQSFT